MSKDRKSMDRVVNWSNEISGIAGEFRPSDTKESWLGRAYSAVKNLDPDLKLSFRHFTDLFYGRVSDPKYSIGSTILSAADRARLEEARSDARKVADIYRQHAEGLARIDEDFHRTTIDALVTAARVLGEGNRAGNL